MCRCQQIHAIGSVAAAPQSCPVQLLDSVDEPRVVLSYLLNLLLRKAFHPVILPTQKLPLVLITVPKVQCGVDADTKGMQSDCCAISRIVCWMC